ncbi:LysR family transcriptional regulator [Archangium minus]|uniref:LysR family transcriptional regulator n=2 Tax=Archangium minus TaxID=83450 RepID=A0ABY9X6T2_9BACT|nr:LysR family transcriptional regulator [Archangium minus]
MMISAQRSWLHPILATSSAFFVSLASNDVCPKYGRNGGPLASQRQDGGVIAQVVELHEGTPVRETSCKLETAGTDGNREIRMPGIRFCKEAWMEWDLLRTFEAVARLGSLTAASKALGVSQSTISRHLARLEQSAGSPLLLREAPLRLTERGSSLLAAMQPMVDAALAARSALEDTPELHGEVTLTTVGEVVRWELTPRLPEFYRAFPHLRLRILADNRRNSLAAGEADVALRLARPVRGELVARKVLSVSYAFFAASSLELHPEVPWLGLTGSLAEIPDQRHAERAFSTRPPRLLVEDIESLGLAVKAGLGVAILSRDLAERLGGMVEVAPRQIGARSSDRLPPRDIWMVVHRSKQRVPRVRALMEWLARGRSDRR